MSFDPRTISKPVYQELQSLYTETKDETVKKEQKSQAVELYTYLSTWGLMRLKSEEGALSQQGKKDVVRIYFQCLEQLSDQKEIAGDKGLKTLIGLGIDDYLGLTGLGLELAQEFSFWANAIYTGIEIGD